jgi:hypothetical protein
VISVERDRNPPFPHDDGKWWRWEAEIQSVLGHTCKVSGWVSGKREQAERVAGEAEAKLIETHVAPVRSKTGQQLWFDRPREPKKHKAGPGRPRASARDCGADAR